MDLGIFHILFSWTFGIQFFCGLTLYDLNPFKFIRNSFMAQNMVYLGKCSCVLEKNVNSAVFGVECFINVRYVGWVDSAVPSSLPS